MIDVKVLAVDKKGSGGTSGGHTNTTAYVPKDIVVSSIRLGDIFLSYDKDNNAIKVAKTDGGAANFYALGGISALGVSGVQGGGGGTSYNRLDSWASYDASKAGWVLSALLGNDLNSRVTSLENGQIEGVATQEWVQQQGYLTELSAATINALGAIKIGYSANGKNYPVLLDNNNRAYVSVPWSDTTYGVFGASANGLVPMASASNKTTAETAVGNYYLCADGKFRQLPANAFNDTWRPLGTGATDACAGNDARLSDARPASDVYDWAKASTKPTYTLDEVADGSARKLSDYLPLTGGTMSRIGTSYPLRINNPTGQNVRLVLELAEVIKGSISYNDSRGTYIAVGDVSPSIYMGIKTDGTPYVVNDSVTENVIWHAGNDGANSGLDADLLDGQHGAYYAKAVDVATLQGYFTNGVANNADKLDGYHADDILPYGLENLCVGAVAAGGRATLNSDGSITTSGTDADTFFYVRCTENLTAGQIYTVGFYVTGVPSGNTATWSWPFASQSNNNLVVNIKSNGWCWGTGTIPNDIAAGTNIIFDDGYRGFYNSINISKFVIVKGRQKAYYTPPISKMSVASAAKLATPRTIWGQSFDGSANVSGAMSGVTSVDGLLYFDTTNGYIGIGTSSSRRELTVAGNIFIHKATSDSRAIIINDPNLTAGYEKIQFCRSEADSAGIHWFHDKFGGYSFLENCVNIVANNGCVTLGAWNAPAVMVTATDNVGIGTTSPNYKLDVAGVIHSSVGMFSDGYVSALGQNTSSDERLKDVHGDINVSIDVLANAPSKLFEWKGNKALGAQVGTIAQYWQRALPQVVHDRGDGYLSMQYDVAALLGTITIAKRVQNHEERIKDLERENEALREQLKELKG